MLVINYKEKTECDFEFPFRMFISGSSQSGKTFFAEKLLRSQLFKENICDVNYRHPDYLEHAPVDWDKTLSAHVSYQSGLPTMEDLLRLEPNTCIVLDDLYEECVNSKVVDYLFRVLSGKKKLSVIIMSQRYFAKGKFGMNIRNNCNYTVLLRNSDARVNNRVSRTFNVHRQVSRCFARKTAYPYVLIDTTPSAMVSGFKVYEDIFSKYQIVYSDDGMRGYVIPENEFNKYFLKVNGRLATLKNANSKTEKFKWRKSRKSRESKKRKFERKEITSQESDESSGKSDFSTKSTESSESSKSSAFSGSERYSD